MIAMSDTLNRAELPHLRKWREWRGYSVRELSALSTIKTGKRAGKHVSHNTISEIENGHGRANWATVAALADALGISREELMREEPH